MAEFIDQLDINRQPTGAVHQRGMPVPAGFLHLLVHICIFDLAGRMLIQQRASDKTGWPGFWDYSVGGSAEAGETSQQAATRELQEELGIAHDFAGRRPAFTLNFEYGFDDFYLIYMPVELSQLGVPNQEVQAARWASFDDILKLQEAGEFIPYRRSAIYLIFDLGIASLPAAG